MTAKAGATSLGIDQEKSTARTETHAARVLPADVYDTLEFSALVYGGVGAWKRRDEKDAPYCLFGHAAFVQVRDPGTWYGAPLATTLERCGLFVGSNDSAVVAINRRKGRRPKDRGTRVTWREYIRETNIVRGDS